METVATPGLEALITRAERALAEEDPWGALTGFLGTTLEAQLTDPSITLVRAAPNACCPAPGNPSTPWTHKPAACSSVLRRRDPFRASSPGTTCCPSCAESPTPQASTPTVKRSAWLPGAAIWG